MTDPSYIVILIGASTRAAAGSALRAGWSPWCIDLFADADLRRMARVRKVAMEEYPQGLLAMLADAPAGPVIYTGALENRPGLIARLNRRVWGNTPDVLRAVRSPERWTQCLHESGLSCPQLRKEPMANGRWLLKPRKSAGGLGIQGYAGQPFDPRTHFLQEWIDGLPCSAIFLGHADEAILLGVTQQLIGTSWLHATGFAYAGNVGPLPIGAEMELRWRNLGIVLAKHFHLRGLFGVDAIVRDGVPWPVEINPRYTAAVEILERSWQAPLLTWHRDVFERNTVSPSPSASGAGEKAIWGKAILYAQETVMFPEDGPWLASLQDRVELDQAEFADIPHGGEIIAHGRPLLTVFASARTVEACLAKLQEKAQALDRCLWG